MVGYPAYFLNCNMFAGIHGDKLFVRLPEKDVENLVGEHSGYSFFELTAGRKMNGYLVLPEKVYRNDEHFTEFIENSIKHVRTHPPKRKQKQ